MTTGLFPETFNAVLKAFDVYRRSYITEKGNLTGTENISKSKYEASFLMFLIFLKKLLYSMFHLVIIFFFDFKLKNCGSMIYGVKTLIRTKSATLWRIM